MRCAVCRATFQDPNVFKYHDRGGCVFHLQQECFAMESKIAALVEAGNALEHRARDAGTFLARMRGCSEARRDVLQQSAIARGNWNAVAKKEAP